MDLDFPVGGGRLPAPLVRHGDELLRQPAVVALDAGYPDPGAALIVRRAVLQGQRVHCRAVNKETVGLGNGDKYNWWEEKPQIVTGFQDCGFECSI